MSTSVDLSAYFKRIGYDKEDPSASSKTLKKLHRLHTQAIPFENLNPLLGLPVKLDTKSLQQKLVYDERGGYCFEHNLLFKRILETIGFSVRVWELVFCGISRKTRLHVGATCCSRLILREKRI